MLQYPLEVEREMRNIIMIIILTIILTLTRAARMCH